MLPRRSAHVVIILVRCCLLFMYRPLNSPFLDLAPVLLACFWDETCFHICPLNSQSTWWDNVQIIWCLVCIILLVIILLCMPSHGLASIHQLQTQWGFIALTSQAMVREDPVLRCLSPQVVTGHPTDWWLSSLQCGNFANVHCVMPGLEDNKLAGRKGCIAFIQSPKVCVVAIASGYNT